MKHNAKRIAAAVIGLVLGAGSATDGFAQAGNRSARARSAPAARSGGANRGANVNRNTNVNRNVNRNVNVNRNANWNGNGNRSYHAGYYGGGGWHGAGWGAAAAVGAAAVTAAAIGSVAYSLPSGCGTSYVNGVGYYQCGSAWYEPQNVGGSTQYVVVNPPQ